MSMFPSSKEVEYLKNRYPAGTRLILHYMEDARAVPAGSLGTVRTVDDAGTIHVDWDCGRRLGVIPGEDSFEIIRD